MQKLLSVSVDAHILYSSWCREVFGVNFMSKVFEDDEMNEVVAFGATSPFLEKKEW